MQDRRPDAFFRNVGQYRLPPYEDSQYYDICILSVDMPGRPRESDDHPPKNL